ncbi:hypothetical protein [Mycolicibacterium frederiksbergense]|uniref:Uncharacterized protein n=1 Tax=Mycolicibacterium frederiksbergense TaxID=117567 RepID=A0A6H0S702_9MYCO|nr:hypothetical protein [Mycolicibacterium frederiksbergense]QIV83044.1 hypothetical protein EXE63_20720 [Mycolicibacterium frederiksbergense]
MSTPDDARAGFQALLNQIPDTMPVSYTAIDSLTEIMRSTRGDDGNVSVEEVQKFANGVLAMLLTSVVELENRMERIDGRAGVPPGFIGNILSEFRT